MPKGAVLKYKTPALLYGKGMEYINEAKATKSPILYSKLLLHLDLANNTFLEYEKRPAFSETVKKLKQEVWAFAEEQLYGKHTLGGMFVLKHFGWQGDTGAGVQGSLTIKWVAPKGTKSQKK